MRGTWLYPWDGVLLLRHLPGTPSSSSVEMYTRGGTKSPSTLSSVTSTSLSGTRRNLLKAHPIARWSLHVPAANVLTGPSSESVSLPDSRPTETVWDNTVYCLLFECLSFEATKFWAGLYAVIDDHKRYSLNYYFPLWSGGRTRFLSSVRYKTQKVLRSRKQLENNCMNYSSFNSLKWPLALMNCYITQTVTLF